MVVSVKQMHAGGGFNYLLKTVADAQGTAGVMAVSHMTAYYNAPGTPSGQWLGNGLSGLAGDLKAGEVVKRQHMEELFRYGRDPHTQLNLGREFNQPATREQRIRRRIKLLPNTLPTAEREQMIAKITADESARKVSKPVAGFDFVFSPVKSVSTLWAVADHGVREQIYEAHRAALADVIATMEDRVVMTRVGTNGVAQVKTRGLIAAAFDHWDARGGDPQLHTHVAVSNRVQGLDGKWRTLDSRGALLPSTVTMSELYNGRIQDHLTQRLGVDWEERGAKNNSKGRWFEIKGVPKPLMDAFSARSDEIDAETDRLIDTYRELHGKTPGKALTIRMRRQAAVTTRPDKQVVSLRDLQTRWRETALSLGVRPDKLVRKVVSTRKPVQLLRFDDLAGTEELQKVFEIAWGELSTNYSVWKTTNAQAAVLRATHHLRLASNEERLRLMDHLVEQINTRAVSVDARLGLHVPQGLIREDGTSAFQRVNAELFTSGELLAAEARLLEKGRQNDGPAVEFDVAARWAGQPTDSGRTLTNDQAQAMEHIAISGRPVDVLVGPAGAGKTTMLSQLRAMWEDVHDSGSVKGLAPSAAAAAVLGEELGIDTDNTAKWLFVQDKQMGEWRAREAKLVQRLSKTTDPEIRQRTERHLARLRDRIERWSLKSGDLLIVDEASLAGTLALDRLATQAADSGAKLLLVGDWAQLAAVEAGGAFGMLVNDREGTAPELDSIHRFKADWEKTASIALRTGDASVLTTYDNENRIHEGIAEDVIDAAYNAWRADTAAGKTSMMIGADNKTVATLNQRAREDRIKDGHVAEGGIELHDGTFVSPGDVIVTRQNDRELATSQTSWVKNGDTWLVHADNGDGSLLVQRVTEGYTGGGPLITLPADYVRQEVELAYATTAHRAQGATVDTAHAIATDSLSREVLYVAMTRGREANHVYVALPDLADPHEAHTGEQTTGLEVLAGVLAHRGAGLSATETLQDEHKAANHLAGLFDEYETIAQLATATKWDEVTRNAIPSLPDTITHSESWASWVNIMRHVESHGLDVTDVIATLGQDLDTPEDPMPQLHKRAAALANKLDMRPTRVHDPRFVGIFTAERSNEPDIARGLAERQAHIETQVQQATQKALRENAAWLRQLGPRPTDPQQAEQWKAAVEGVVAYRLMYDVDDHKWPLGNKSPVANWRQASHKRRATWLIEQVSEPTQTRQVSVPKQERGLRI